MKHPNLNTAVKLHFFSRTVCIYIVLFLCLGDLYAQNKVDIDGTLNVQTSLNKGPIILAGPSGELRLTPYYGNTNGLSSNLLGYLDGKTFGTPQIRFDAAAHNFLDLGMDVAGAFVVENADAPVFKIDPLGNAVIGKYAPQAFGYTLSVGGKIASEEILVDLKADWPDYVFKKDYELMSLSELRKHIYSKGHLPGLPAASEVQDVGIELGEMNRVLVEKIEELTLYILQQEERIKALEDKDSAKN